jgi:hypothetical protein
VCGDYAIGHDGRIICAVERKTVDDLVSSLTSGRLRFALTELAGLPRAAVAVEGGYSRIFAQRHVPGAMVADGLAELQVRYPSVPIVHCDSRKLAEEWTYRFLAAAHAWARDEPAARARVGISTPSGELAGPPAPSPSSAELRGWARAHGIAVSDRGRVSHDVLEAWQAAASLAAAEA